MKESGKKVLLKHSSGWAILYDYGFPSGNYIVMKPISGHPLHKLASSYVAYCGSLEHALKCLFSQLIIVHTEKNKKYCGSIQDLQKAINDAYKDFEQLLKPLRGKL